METDLTRRKPIRRWLKRAIDLPGTLSHLRVWAACLSKAWAWLLVVMPGPVILLRSWLVDRILDVVVIGLSFVVSAAGVLLLRSQAKRPNPEVERLKALTPRIREARDTFHEMGPSGGQRFISLTIELAAHLEALGVHCPAELGTGNRVTQWVRFLDRLLPLAELGRLEEARDLCEPKASTAPRG